MQDEELDPKVSAALQGLCPRCSRELKGAETICGACRLWLKQQDSVDSKVIGEFAPGTSMVGANRELLLPALLNFMYLLALPFGPRFSKYGGAVESAAETAEYQALLPALIAGFILSGVVLVGCFLWGYYKPILALLAASLAQLGVWTVVIAIQPAIVRSLVLMIMIGFTSGFTVIAAGVAWTRWSRRQRWLERLERIRAGQAR